jgi:hypothetical protein
VLAVLVSVALAACGDHDLPSAVRAPGQPVNSLDFTSFGSQPMTLMGSAAVRSGALVLANSGNQIGAAWFGSKQRFSGSWETSFQFRIESAGCGAIGDGFAFVIQNDRANALATGTSGSDLGYSSFRSALAVEFDTYKSDFYPYDFNANHIAVVGINAGATTISARNQPFASFDAPSMKDGQTHSVRFTYQPGRLAMYYDGAATPAISVAINLLNVNGASVLDANGAAWVGFTSATGGACAQFKILNWNLVDNKAPVASAGGTVGPNGVATYNAVEGQPLTLTASATDPDGDAISAFEWDLNNDGTVDQIATTPSISHTWKACGTVPISVVAVDAFGSRSAPGLAQVVVANLDPQVAALPPLEAYPGRPMSVSTTFSDVEGDGPWSYEIDWGDGSARVTGSTATSRRSSAERTPIPCRGPPRTRSRSPSRTSVRGSASRKPR